ncbi:DUF4175 domain-containing protein [Vibrio mangrovi]|uniref:Zinc resistance-associated protein n=1 Tax=Vibrio mangrovi TaxID=474394 RepID=A0A1Y6IZ53_9VIBR|nr:DUF4175 domain-containing protein [Vibrio mangrovi]MDW6005123.1 hypothetical protein [Vibrio mangrovi]SMS02955.1 hypothetical protein VIM7927_04317 [Vibrio mangrovi]
MKTHNKIVFGIVALVLSAGAMAHYAGHGYMAAANGNGGRGQQTMMNVDHPMHQAMNGTLQERQQRMQQLHSDPQAMQQWMTQMHRNAGNYGNGIGCHGNWNVPDNDEAEK